MESDGDWNCYQATDNKLRDYKGGVDLSPSFVSVQTNLKEQIHSVAQTFEQGRGVADVFPHLVRNSNTPPPVLHVGIDDNRHFLSMQRFNATLNSHCSSIQQCSACRQYASAVERMHQLEESLAIAKDKVVRLAKARNIVHDPLSNVPQEVASRIMEVFYEDNSSYVGRPTKRFPPFKFGAVCQSWRVVAWSTPHIWSTMHFILKNRRGKKDFTRRIKLLEQYLARSGDLPLTIEVAWDEGFELESEEFLTDEETSLELIDVLVSWLRRWHTVKLHFTPEMFHYMHRKTLRKHGASCPSTLRSLHLSTINPDGIFLGTSQFMDWTSITNGLRNLVVSSFSDFELDMLKVDCSRLEELEGCGSADALSHFLRASPLLQAAKIDIGEDVIDQDHNIDEDYPDEFGQPFIHGTLSKLKFNFDGDYNMSSIFTNLTCPNLDTLAIEKRGTRRLANYLDPLPQFLSRSPKLRELTLSHISWTNTILRQIFSSLHSVGKVGIWDVTPAFVSRVLNAGDPDCLLWAPLPHSLRILSFEGVLWTEDQEILSWDFLPTLVEHDFGERRQQCASEDADFLIKITINASRLDNFAIMLLQPQHLEAIATLNTTGIKIEISLSNGFPELETRDLVVLSASVWEEIQV